MLGKVSYSEIGKREVKLMKAIEIAGVVDEQGHLSLHEPVPPFAPGAVRIIILYPEPAAAAAPDPDDTPVAAVKASLRRAWQEAAAGERIPLANMWDGIDPE